MKKHILWGAAAATSLLLSCSGGTPDVVIRLDLSQTTVPEKALFDSEGLWTETYSETYPFIEAQCFAFSHLPEGNSFQGIYYDGFTLCNSYNADANATATTASQEDRGIYLSAYWSSWSETATGSNYVRFSTPCRPQHMYVCNTAYTVKAIKEGMAELNARPFGEGDHFDLLITALDENLLPAEGTTVTFSLADYRQGKHFIAEEWTRVDLTPLGECNGLMFTMQSTDIGEWGMNTPTYFTLEGLTVKQTQD